MGLKQDVVIKNQFTVNRNGVATKGATPGFYVLQYMARANATETLSPVQYRGIEDFQLRYMARKSATDKAISRDRLKYEIKRNEGKSGVAFSESNISMSDKELKEHAQLIQNAFDAGHTVQEIVLSFDEDFLKSTGIVDEAFHVSGPGSYKGNIDQLKLRHAVTDGLMNMASGIGYKKPVFTAVIQVDTKHVHTHIAMCDTEFSEKRMTDNEEKGKLSEKAKTLIRRGMVNSLREMSNQHAFRNQVDVERRNVIAFVKRFAFGKFQNGSRLQILMSSLPPNKNLWRASSNARVMRRPNELAREFLNEVFARYPEESGFSNFQIAFNNYVDEKAINDNLSPNEKRALSNKIMNQFYERCINGLYETIKSNNLDQSIMTSMINLSIKDLDELIPNAKKNDDSVAFEVRVRGYKDRLNYYRNQADLFNQYLENYYRQPTSEESRVMAEFFREEVTYNRNLVKKYSHFLNYRKPPTKEQLDEAERLYKEYEKIQQQKNDYLLLLTNPPSKILDMSPLEQDAYIKEEYGIAKGSWFFDEALRIDIKEEFDVIMTEYTLKREEYEKYLLDNDMTASAVIVNESESELSEPKRLDAEHDDFDNVKALDLHMLTFDFPEGADVSENNIKIFYDNMTRRRQAYDNAMMYIIGTGQNPDVFNDIKSDIEEMEDFYENVLSKVYRIEPPSIEEEEEMQRSLAPHIEEIENEPEIVNNLIKNIEVAKLDIESESEPAQQAPSETSEI